VLALGYALMAIPTENTWALFGALGVIVVGNGLFKANAGNLVRKIYEGDDSKIDSAFTIYYMAVNIGSTISMLLTPWIKDYVNQTWGHELGWHAAFAVCSFGLILGILNYATMRHTLRHISSPPDQEPIHLGKLGAVLGLGALAVLASAYILNSKEVARIFVYIAGAVVLGIFIYLISNSKKSERSGLTAAFVLTIQTVFFFVFYQQMSTSLNLFALRNVDWSFNLFGLHLWNWKPAQFQSFNPIWIMILSPILAWMYTHAGKSGKDLSIAAKFALGFACVGIGFFIYSSAPYFTSMPGKTSSWIMVWGYGFGSLGELLVSGLGLAMIARYVPERMGGFMMGAYFVASGISQYLGGVVANFASVPDKVANLLKVSPTPSMGKITELYPNIMQIKVDQFRQWIGVLPIKDPEKLHKALTSAHIAPFNTLPTATQQALTNFSNDLYTATMPIYTKLFFWLGVAGVGCTIIALIMLPLMRRLNTQHHSHNLAAETGLPTIGSEE
jgi:POT family proton-dependent oligopeptide transporter